MSEELKQCRETNRRLNRRLQELESEVNKNRLYSMGWYKGRSEGYEHAEKKGAAELAAYKAATRKEMARLRAMTQPPHGGENTGE